MKKTLIIMLLLGFVLSLAFAGGSVESSSSIEIDEDFVVTYPVENDGYTLDIWCPIQAPAAKYITSYNEQEVYNQISADTGISTNYMHPALGQEAEQLGLLIAGGDLPDIIQIRNLYSGGASSGVEDGIFLDLSDLVKTYAPDYYALITKDDLTYKLATDNDGRIVAFHLLKSTAPEFNRMNFTSAVIDKYGIDEMPVTIDDYEEIFSRMAADGLAGIALPMNGRLDQFMWPYGITNDFYIKEDGTVGYGPYTENYKDYLELMHTWYEKGYIYKDFMSNLSTNQRRALYSNLQVGMLYDSVDLAKSQAESAGLESVPANYPRLYEGQKLHFQTVNFDTLPVTVADSTMATVVTSDCEHPELAVQYLNYFYTQEGADLCNWGIKDKAYTVDENGEKHFTDYMLNNPEIALGDVQTMLKIHLTAKLSEPDVVCNPNVVSNEEALELRMLYADDPDVDNSQVLPTFDLSADASYDRSKIMRDITTYIDEMTIKFITGVTPLDEYDDYMAQLKQMGIEDAIQITQDEYVKFMSKPGLESL